MTMDPDARALVAQLVKALAPLNYPALTTDQQSRPDTDPVWPSTTPTLG